MAFEPRDTRDQRRECRRRSDHQLRERICPAPSFDVAFAQVQQMAPRLHLDCAPQLGGVNPEPLEGVRACDEGVVGEDSAELERKGIERAIEFVGGEKQRSRHACVMPACHAPGTGAQVVSCQRIDNGEHPQLSSVW